ncbi:MAG: hypothetical protein AB8B58_08265 [Roseobacter sp.]
MQPRTDRDADFALLERLTCAFQTIPLQLPGGFNPDPDADCPAGQKLAGDVQTPG